MFKGAIFVPFQQKVDRLALTRGADVADLPVGDIIKNITDDVKLLAE